MGALDDSVPNFTGNWTLRTSENLDTFLKAEGWGYIMRKAAAAVRAYQYIEQPETEIKIRLKNKKSDYTYTAKLDGSTVKYVDGDKDNVESQTVIDGKTLVETKKKKLVRYMEGGEMKLRIIQIKENGEEGEYCIR